MKFDVFPPTARVNNRSTERVSQAHSEQVGQDTFDEAQNRCNLLNTLLGV